jgi:hypothetical protein
VHAPFRDDFSIEMSQFLDQPDILEEGRPPRPGCLDIDVIGNRRPGGMRHL